MKKFQKAFYPEETDKVKKRYLKDNPMEEVYLNDIYQVAVHRGINIGEDVTIAHLSIKRRDKKAQMDWRHLQYIKNELVGEECEGCELFPAESRMVDGANQFHLWVFENPEHRFPFGFSERVVTDSTVFGETQRPFDKDRIPSDLEENNKKLKEMHKKLSQ